MHEAKRFFSYSPDNLREENGEKRLPVESAGAIIVTDHGEVLLFQRSMDATDWPGCWQLPAGRREKGKSIEQTIEEELVQEVSYAPANLTLVGFLRVTKYSEEKAIYWAPVGAEEAELFIHNATPQDGTVEGMGADFFPIDVASALPSEQLTPGTAQLLKEYGETIKAHALQHTIPTHTELGLLPSELHP